MNNNEILKILDTPTVRKQLDKKGIDRKEVISQIETFRSGFPYARIVKPCTVGDGVVKLDKKESDRYVEIYEKKIDSIKAAKFVPASGAASRMFRELAYEYNLLKNEPNYDPQKLSFTHKFISRADKFAFFNDLKLLISESGYRFDELTKRKRYFPVLDALLSETGLNYSNVPKGLIKFHRYNGDTRTAFEEHLAEAKSHLVSYMGTAHLHFTVPGNYKDKVRDEIESKTGKYSSDNIKFDVSFSVQSESTDTVAVNKDNLPVTVHNGELLFRPGGHGALLDNLNNLDSEIIFIKNIDNILVESFLPLVSYYKKVLGGYLLQLRDRIFHYLRKIEGGGLNRELVMEIEEFCNKNLFCSISSVKAGKSGDYSRSYEKILNRPLRVCGVVKNEGEPGGGPFWVQDGNGNLSLQIVESAQIDMGSTQQKKIWDSSTHFNPVDLVCGVFDHKGNKYDLSAYSDKKAGIITQKSSDGKVIKALELPGLWNGSMADWSTVFVEVPVETFSPVKTVFDLLRKEHQGVQG